MPGHEVIVHPGTAIDFPARNHLDAAADDYAAAAKSAATQRAYSSDWRHFTGWCRGHGAEPLPASDVTLTRYFASLARDGLSVSTIDRRAAAIGFAHRRNDCDNPISREAVRLVLSGIRNTVGRRPKKKKALTADLVAKVVRKIPTDLAGLRDRAMIALCFAAALRRSELVALDVADLETHRRGLLVLLRRSKTDQSGKGRTVAVLDGKLKVPDAVATWLAASGIVEGAVFRGCDRGKLSTARLTGGQFARMLKTRVSGAGLDPTLFSGHSPRRGFATSADDVGADLRATSLHLRHAKLETTAGYMEAGDLFRKNAGKGFV